MSQAYGTNTTTSVTIFTQAIHPKSPQQLEAERLQRDKDERQLNVFFNTIIKLHKKKGHLTVGMELKMPLFERGDDYILYQGLVEKKNNKLYITEKAILWFTMEMV